MMNSKLGNVFRPLGLAFFMTILILCSACSSFTETKEETDATEDLVEAKEDLDKAKKDYLKKYEAFKLESNQKIAENEKNIALLKSINKGKAAKTELDALIATFEEKNELLKKQINEYEESDLSKWESFKIEFNRDMETLGSALRDLTKKNVK
jgi:hypothetical protein